MTSMTIEDEAVGKLLGEGEFLPAAAPTPCRPLGGRGVRTACRLMLAGVSLDTLVLILRLALVSALMGSLEALGEPGGRSSRHAAGRDCLEALRETGGGTCEV